MKLIQRKAMISGRKIRFWDYLIQTSIDVPSAGIIGSVRGAVTDPLPSCPLQCWHCTVWQESKIEITSSSPEKKSVKYQMRVRIDSLMSQFPGGILNVMGSDLANWKWVEPQIRLARDLGKKIRVWCNIGCDPAAIAKIRPDAVSVWIPAWESRLFWDRTGHSGFDDMMDQWAPYWGRWNSTWVLPLDQETLSESPDIIGWAQSMGARVVWRVMPNQRWTIDQLGYLRRYRRIPGVSVFWMDRLPIGRCVGHPTGRLRHSLSEFIAQASDRLGMFKSILIQ